MNDDYKTREELINELALLGQQLAEAEQSTNELRFHSEILRNMSQGVYLIRVSNGLFVFTNPTSERMFGYESGELIGKHVSVLYAYPHCQDHKSAKVSSYLLLSHRTCTLLVHISR